MNNKLLIPGAIIIAGIIIGGAVIFGGDNTSTQTPPSQDNEEQATTEIDINPVSADDHILGNPNAPVMIVEFSDLECPFCKTFHRTLQSVIDEYGTSGEVAWVYRHFPIEQLHPKAAQEAQATECAADLGGNDAFWAYTNRIFEITPSNNGLELSILPTIAEEIGLDRAEFESCLASGRFADEVQTDFDDAIAAGGTGTPYSVVIGDGDTFIPLNGAVSADAVRQAIDRAMNVQ